MVLSEAQPLKTKRFFPRLTTTRFDDSTIESMNENGLLWLENLYRSLENSPVKKETMPKKIAAKEQEVYDILQEIHDLTKRGIL